MKFIMRSVVILLVALMLVSCSSKKRIVTKKRHSKPRIERVVKHEQSTPSAEREDKIIEEVIPVPTPPKPPSNADVTEIYIANYSAIAQKNMRMHKIPASITLAQGILESGSGRGRLAVEGNNHFGIKCHGWTGAKIHHDDDSSQECFRKYQHAEQSFEDHSQFLTSRGRYAKLFQLNVDDYKGWARGLRAAGYATDRKYPDKLIGLIERLELYKYDQEVLGTVSSTPKYTTPSSNLTHKVVPGDTMYSLSKRYNLTVSQLQKLNGMSNNDLQVGQILIIKYN